MNVELEALVRRANELNAFMEGVRFASNASLNVDQDGRLTRRCRPAGLKSRLIKSLPAPVEYFRRWEDLQGCKAHGCCSELQRHRAGERGVVWSDGLARNDTAFTSRLVK